MATAPRAPRPELAAFWTWWRAASHDFETADAHGAVRTARAAELGEQLERVAPGLSWEVGRSDAGRYWLAVTADGEHELFAPAARLIAAAPDDDPRWQFSSSRPPRANPAEAVIERDDRRYRLSDTRFSIGSRDEGEMVDIKLDHPALGGLPSGRAEEISLLLLDSLLGEDAVERHIGAISIGRMRFGAKDHQDLADAVASMARLRARRRAEGIEHYGFFDTSRDGLPGVATATLSHTHRDNPTFDTRAELRIPLRHPTPNGLTTDNESDVLGKLRTTIQERMGSRGVVTSRDTHAGWHTITIAFDADDQPIRTFLERLPEAWKSSYAAEVTMVPDPTWEHARAFLDSARRIG